MALYLPYIHLSPNSGIFDSRTQNQPPLEIIKLGASAIARKFEVITSQTIHEEIPLAM
jgi:hypothetical protein